MVTRTRAFLALIVIGSAAVLAAAWFGYFAGALKVNQETQRAQDLLSAPETTMADQDQLQPLVSGVPSVGEFFAVLRIPALGQDWLRTVSVGTTPDILDELGVGHYEGTELPGEPGNFALAGHSGSSWTPFAKLDKVAIGELVEIETLTSRYVYEIIKTETVEETDVDTVYKNPEFGTQTAGDQWLTITTCLTEGPQNLRYVVYAKLVKQENR